MDKPLLTQEEADLLLNLMKKSIDEYLSLPNSGDSTEISVSGIDTNDIFKISIFKSKIANKINFGARVSKNNVMLLELHINPTNIHPNPDGEKIIGNHWHIYKEGYNTRWAFPAEDIKNNNFIDITMKYLEKFNVVETPYIDFKLDIDI